MNKSDPYKGALDSMIPGPRAQGEDPYAGALDALIPAPRPEGENPYAGALDTLIPQAPERGPLGQAVDTAVGGVVNMPSAAANLVNKVAVDPFRQALGMGEHPRAPMFEGLGPEQTYPGALKSMPPAFAQALTGMGTGLMRGGAVMFNKPDNIEFSPGWALANQIDDWAEKKFPVDPNYQGTFFPDMAGATASMGTFLATGGGAGAGARALATRGGMGAANVGRVQKTAQLGTAIPQAALHGTTEAYGRAREFGLGPHEAKPIALKAGPISGAVQVGNINILLRPFSAEAKRKLFSGTRGQMLYSVLSEFGVESAGALGQNIGERTYNPDRGLKDDVAYRGMIGGLTAGGMTAGRATAARLHSALTDPDGSKAELQDLAAKLEQMDPEIAAEILTQALTGQIMAEQQADAEAQGEAPGRETPHSPEPPAPSATTPETTPAYDAEAEAAREATRKFREAQEAYRRGEITDEEFLAARQEHEAASERFDTAFKKEQEVVTTPEPQGEATASDPINLTEVRRQKVAKSIEEAEAQSRKAQQALLGLKERMETASGEPFIFLPGHTAKFRENIDALAMMLKREQPQKTVEQLKSELTELFDWVDSTRGVAEKLRGTLPQAQVAKPPAAGEVTIPDGIQFNYPTVRGDFRWGGTQAFFSFRLNEGTPIQRSPTFESDSLAEAVAQAVDWVRKRATTASDAQKRILERQIEDSLMKVEGAKGLLKTQPLIDLSRQKEPGKRKPKAAPSKDLVDAANEFIAWAKAQKVHPEAAWVTYASQNAPAFRINKAEFMKRYAPGHKVTDAQQRRARALLEEAEAAGNQAAVIALRDLAEARDPTEGGVPVDSQLKAAQEMLKKREAPAAAQQEAKAGEVPTKGSVIRKSRSRDLMICNCSKNKSDDKGLVPAEQRYKSAATQMLQGDKPDIVFLSSKYGFIGHDTPLDNYEQKMTAKRADEILDDDEQLRRLRDTIEQGGYNRILIVGGGEYRQIMRSVVQGAVEDGLTDGVDVEYAPAEIGKMRHTVKAWSLGLPDSEVSAPETEAEAPAAKVDETPEGKPTRISQGKNFVEVRPVEGGWEVSVNLETKNSGKRFKLEFPDNKPFPSKEDALRAAAKRVGKLATDMMLDSWGKFAYKIAAQLPEPTARKAPEPDAAPTKVTDVEVGKSRSVSGTPTKEVKLTIDGQDYADNGLFQLSRNKDGLWTVDMRQKDPAFQHAGFMPVAWFTTPKQAETFLRELVQHVTGLETHNMGRYTGNVTVPVLSKEGQALLDPPMTKDAEAALKAIKPAEAKRGTDGLMRVDMGDGQLAMTDGKFLLIGKAGPVEGRFKGYPEETERSPLTKDAVDRVTPKHNQADPTARVMAVLPASSSATGTAQIAFSSDKGPVLVNAIYLRQAGYTQESKVYTKTPTDAIKLVNPDGSIGVVMPMRTTPEHQKQIADFEKGKVDVKDVPLADADSETDMLRRPGKRTGKKGRTGPYSATRQGAQAETREKPNTTAQMHTPAPDVKSSRNEQIWIAAGHDPDTARLMPIEKQFTIASQQLKKEFGFKAIEKDPNLQTRDAVDVLMDAYVGLHSMAAALGVNPAVMSMKGDITLRLHKSKGEALAYFSHVEDAIGMVRRNDSYAHEWGHKLDWDLVKKYAQDILGKRGRALSGKVRVGGKQTEQLPNNVKEAFGNLLNAMFFNDAQLATELMTIETALADPKTTMRQRKILEKRLQALKDGAARPRRGKTKATDQESTYYKISKALDGATGAIETDGGQGYWQRPTEMLARAFEAYVAHKIELAEVLNFTDFVGMKSRLYSSVGTRFMGVAYPKSADQVAIFQAFDDLISTLREEGILETRTGDDPVLDAIQLVEDMPLDPKLKAKVKKRMRSFRHEAQTRKRIAHQQEKATELRMRQIHDRLNAKGQRVNYFNERRAAMIQTLENSVMAYNYTIRGMLFAMRDRYPNSQAIAQIIEWFATDPGSGDSGGAKFEETLRMETRKTTSKLKDIQIKSGLMFLSAEQIDQVHRLLTDKQSASDLTQLKQNEDGKAVIKAAAALRRFADNMYSLAQSHGIDIGYVGNYMKRMVSSDSVRLNQQGFLDAAAQEYENVFARDFGHPDDGVVLDDFIPEARQRITKGDTLYPQRQAVDKAFKAAEEAAEEYGEGSPESQAAEAALLDAVELIYDEVRSLWAQEAAQNWHDAIMGYGTALAFGSPRGPTSKSTKPRQLTENADKIMKEYLITDPMELMTTYATQMTRLRVYSDFFGAATNNKAAGYKLAETLDLLKREHTLQNDVDQVVRAVELMTGKYRTVITRAGLQNWAKFNARLVPFVMSRALFSQLHEPVTIAIRSGNVLDTPGVFGMQLQDISSMFPGVDINTVAWRKEMGEFLGVYTDALAEEIMQSRFNLLYQSLADNRMLAKFFIVSLIHPHAMSMRRAAMSKAFEFIPKIARRAMKHHGTAKGKAALLALQDLGIYTQAEVEAAAKIHKGMSTSELENTPEFSKLNTAIVRFVDESVQDPKVVDKPRLATQPEFSYIFGLLSFNSAFQRNVIRRAVKWQRTLWNDAGKTEAAKSTAATAAGFGLLVYGQFLSLMVRMSIFGGKDFWDEMDDTEKALAMASRVGALGLVDPAFNAVTGAKYRRGIEGILSGPYVGSALTIPYRGITAYQNKDANTNTQQYKGLEAMYDLSTILAISWALERTPAAGPAARLLGPGIMYATSKQAREGAAEVAGEAAGLGPKSKPRSGVPLRFQ